MERRYVVAQVRSGRDDRGLSAASLRSRSDHYYEDRRGNTTTEHDKHSDLSARVDRRVAPRARVTRWNRP
jgi:hypothetical protein